MRFQSTPLPMMISYFRPGLSFIVKKEGILVHLSNTYTLILAEITILKQSLSLKLTTYVKHANFAWEMMLVAPEGQTSPI